MKKQFQQYLESQPQLERNWDPAARRPPAPKEKSKPKAKPKKKDGNQGESDIKFEDVAFVTPPLTPPPKPESPVKAEPVQKDDEFWDFYHIKNLKLSKN